MKRSYYLIAAGVLAAMVGGFFAFGGHKKKPETAAALTAEPPVAEPESSSSSEETQALLPPVNPPSDGPLAIPAAGSPSTAPTVPKPAGLPADLPVAITFPQVPETPSGDSSGTGIPSVPSVPVVPTPPAVPFVPSPATLPVPPVVPVGTVAATPPADGPPPIIPVAPAPPTPAISTPITGLPATASTSPDAPSTVAVPTGAKYLVLRGKVGEVKPGTRLLAELMASKLVAIDGIAPSEKAKDKEAWLVRQGTIVRSIPKAEVIFAGETKDDVYHFMRGRADRTDAATRLVVARWCMFNGMREQALVEARECLSVQPDNRAARELIHSLEESLKQFPANGLPATTTDSKPAPMAEGDVDVTPEAATTFATRVQPILANLCVECHGRPDYTGSFKLAKVEGFEASPQTTQANLRAVAGQLKKSDPANSPLLTKAILAHGGLRQPPFQSRQAAGYRILEIWTALAIGSTAATTEGTTAAPVPGSTPAPSTTPVLPAGGSDPTSLPALPAAGLPPVQPVPMLPTPPPVVSVPSVPPVPTSTLPAPPIVTIPPVLPTPPAMTPRVPSQPPALPMGTLPAVPVPPAGGSQFGSVPPVPKPPMARDEFDPAPFNTK